MVTRKNGGFTLVEVIVAMTILVIIAAVCFNGLSAVLKARNVSKERLQALELCQTAMEEIRASQDTQDGSGTWTTIDGLRTWLSNNGYVETPSYVFKKNSINNNLTYTIEVDIRTDTGVTGLFGVSASAVAADISRVSIDTRLRGS